MNHSSVMNDTASKWIHDADSRGKSTSGAKLDAVSMHLILLGIKNVFPWFLGYLVVMQPEEILWVNLLPIAKAAYATVHKEAAHQNILRATNNEPHGIATGLIAEETKGVGFVTKGYRRNDGKKKWLKEIMHQYAVETMNGPNSEEYVRELGQEAAISTQTTDTMPQ
nr:hypothetical protein [Tanacetum cinerariifolium]